MSNSIGKTRISTATMQLAITHLDAHGIEFVLKGATDAFANSIRRTLLGDVESLAISSVEILSNTTAFPDEILAHRFGMIPLHDSDAEDAQYELSVKDYDGDVFSDGVRAVAGAPEAQCGIFLLPITSDQVLKIKAYARRGVASEHARYGACVAPAYAIRHDGVTADECMCADTPRDARCSKCGLMSATLAQSRGELVHAFTFETTGIRPDLLLRKSLDVLHSNVTGLAIALMQS